MIPNPIPKDRQARWELTASLIERWFGSPPDGERTGVAQLDLDQAERRLGITVPESLREWYVRFGARVVYVLRRRK